eukprot:GHVS01009718.1.p1 GENE.GHVS01009718.1~~GHVS01009718.1.p1  ORF type:complete len:291 (+),score=34.89 GHVS01009718.1:140-1012(+)
MLSHEVVAAIFCSYRHSLHCSSSDSPRVQQSQSMESLLTDASKKEALVAIEDDLRRKLILDDTDEWARGWPANQSLLSLVGGVDVSFVKDSDKVACAALLVCAYPSMEIVYSDVSMVKLELPYVSGFLGFRESSFFLEKLQFLRTNRPEVAPQVLLVDGNGVLHPRSCGFACHIGVGTNCPSVGVAKNLLHVDGLTKEDQSLKNKIRGLSSPGDSFDLVGLSGRTWGRALRTTSQSVNPVYVSIGHKVSLPTACAVVQACCIHRVPEPIRQADILSKQYLRDNFRELLAL